MLCTYPHSAIVSLISEWVSDWVLTLLTMLISGRDPTYHQWVYILLANESNLEMTSLTASRLSMHFRSDALPPWRSLRWRDGNAKSLIRFPWRDSKWYNLPPEVGCKNRYDSRKSIRWSAVSNASKFVNIGMRRWERQRPLRDRRPMLRLMENPMVWVTLGNNFKHKTEIWLWGLKAKAGF